MERRGLEHLIKTTVDRGPSEAEFTLLNIIALFDDSMRYFCSHADICDAVTKPGKLTCNCGAEAAKQTYEEINTLLVGEREH